MTSIGILATARTTSYAEHPACGNRSVDVTGDDSTAACAWTQRMLKLDALQLVVSLGIWSIHALLRPAGLD
jgi:hypothetical protein